MPMVKALNFEPGLALPEPLLMPGTNIDGLVVHRALPNTAGTRGRIRTSGDWTRNDSTA